MKKLVTLLLFAMSLVEAEQFLNNTNPNLTDKEAYSLKQAKIWINNGTKSVRGKDGSITFMYGLTMPSIVSAPLRITDIQLEAGEKIREVQLGDTVRWQVSPSISGTPPNEVSHVIVKPTDVALETTLAIFTDRRTYNLNLKSTKASYMPIVNFQYADAIENRWKEYQKYVTNQNEAKKFQTVSGANPVNIEKLNFNYRINGDCSWKPLRVYNDGIKTYIQMPQSMRHREAPVLMVLDHGDNQLVNYRLKGDRFVVDKLFTQAVLLKGVGSTQEKVTISYGEKELSW
ncbi:MAG: P-type conjugative transfer protein TrbG [Campylobacterales bacterium]|nr:P-type conjugative transfer protein TrbG [Campylobacterales bacterium]